MRHNNRQNFNDVWSFVAQSPGAHISYPIGSLRCQRIFKDQEGTWFAYNHKDGVNHTTLGATYDPPFMVRFVKVEGEDHTLVYDMPGDPGDGSQVSTCLHCVDDYLPEVMHMLQVTRVYLGRDDTGCDAVTLYA